MKKILLIAAIGCIGHLSSSAQTNKTNGTAVNGQNTIGNPAVRYDQDTNRNRVHPKTWDTARPRENRKSIPPRINPDSTRTNGMNNMK